jgi:hypothetical protein
MNLMAGTTTMGSISGAKIQGTVIGNRRLWQLSGTTAEAVRLMIDSAKDSPAIAELSVY